MQMIMVAIANAVIGFIVGACGLSGLMASATAIIPSSRPPRLNSNGVLPSPLR